MQYYFQLRRVHASEIGKSADICGIGAAPSCLSVHDKNWQLGARSHSPNYSVYCGSDESVGMHKRQTNSLATVLVLKCVTVLRRVIDH